jgi:hypothetical protein
MKMKSPLQKFIAAVKELRDGLLDIPKKLSALDQDLKEQTKAVHEIRDAYNESRESAPTIQADLQVPRPLQIEIQDKKTVEKLTLLFVIVYTVITAFIFLQTKKSADAAKRSADAAVDSLHIAYRPRVVIDGITNQGLEQAGYRVTFDVPNFGSVPAKNVRFFVFYGIGSSREAKRIAYTERADESKVILPKGREGVGHAIFILLTPAEQKLFQGGALMTVSILIDYEGEFPGIVYHAETCSIFPLKGDNGVCPWPVQND